MIVLLNNLFNFFILKINPSTFVESLKLKKYAVCEKKPRRMAM